MYVICANKRFKNNKRRIKRKLYKKENINKK